MTLPLGGPSASLQRGWGYRIGCALQSIIVISRRPRIVHLGGCLASAVWVSLAMIIA